LYGENENLNLKVWVFDDVEGVGRVLVGKLKNFLKAF
jgi:hypothetical protein